MSEKSNNQIMSTNMNKALIAANELNIKNKSMNIDVPSVVKVILEDKTFTYIHQGLKDCGVKNLSVLLENFNNLFNSAAQFSETSSQNYEDYLKANDGILQLSSTMKNIMSNIVSKESLVNVLLFMKEVVSIHQYKDVFVKSGLIIEDYKSQSHEEEHNDGSDDEELKEYLINYNEKMKEEMASGVQMPVIGRSDETRALINIISRKGKRNPILVGKPGVGKTAIVEGFIQRLLVDDVPNDLKGKEVYMLDLNALSAGAKYRGDLEERMKKILDFVEKNQNAILFIDEIHTMLSAGKTEGSAGVGGILKTHLARGYVTCIGTTTFDEYREFIEADKAMERRFMKIVVNEATELETITVLRGIKKSYEQYHGVDISDSAIYAAVELSTRYIKDKNLPDKAIDLLDVASAKVKVENDTVPESIDKLKRTIQQIDIQLNSLTDSDDKNTVATIEELKSQKTEVQQKLSDLEEKLVSEKSLIEELQKLKQRSVSIEMEIIEATKKGDLNEVARLTYSEKNSIVQEIKDIEQKMKDENGNYLFELLKIKIDQESIADAVSDLTGIPVRKLLQGEAEKLLTLEDQIMKRVVGQKEATEVISDVIRISKTGVAEENKPVGAFLFLGPTGVGKTEITKALAEVMFGNENDVIRFDMSEFSEKHSVAKLIGAPPGYVGYESGGELTEAVKRKPYSIVLFDEVEKAHSKFSDILLQVLDDGRLTDGLGNTIDFTNTIIVLTSNIGSSYILDKTEESEEKGIEIDKPEMSNEIMRQLKEHFRPEFINRLSDIVIFNALRKKDINGIAEIQLKKLAKRVLKSQKFNLSWDEKALNEIAELGFDPKFGARPLKRAIADHLQKSLSKQILSHKFKEGDNVIISYDGENFTFDIK